MPELAAWTRPGPYHIIRHALLRLPAEFISGSQLTYSSSYGTLLGSEIFQVRNLSSVDDNTQALTR